MHTNHMMYDYNRTKHMMCRIEYQESERDGKELDFFGPGLYNYY